MMPDPKKIASGLLGPAEPDADDSDSLAAAAQDFLDAVKSDSAQELADAFRAMFDLMGS